MHRFDQGWRELNRVEEVVSVGISVLSAVCLVLFCVLGTAALYELQIKKLKEVTMKCADRTGQKLISETVRTDGSVECRYMRNVTSVIVK